MHLNGSKPLSSRIQAKSRSSAKRWPVFLLAVSFLSLFLLSVEGFEYLEPIAANATRYVPVLLVPVTITMIVAVPEVMFRAQELMVQTFRPLELYTGAAIIYVALIVVFSYGMRLLEKIRKWDPI